MAAIFVNSGLLECQAANPAVLGSNIIQETYTNFVVQNPTLAICLIAYVVITLFLIAFLSQPKAARTWVRPSRKKGKPSPKVDSQDQIADLCGTPVIPAGNAGKTAGAGPRQQSSASHKTMPPLVRKDRVSVQHVPAARESAAVLYVTDNDSSESLQDSLGAAGMAVISSAPGKEAVRNISVTKFDIIIIDTLVAEAARLCATRILEALPPKPRMPMLIVINHPGQTLSIAATNAKIEYIFRPFDEGFLVAKVGMALAQKDKEPVMSSGQAAQSVPYDRQMEKLIESLPAVADGIQQKSEQKSLSNIELQSGVLSALGEKAAAELGEKLKGPDQQPLADEIKKTAEQVDELLRLCASVRPPKQQN